MELGKDVTVTDLLDQFEFFSGWEEKYECIIDLGKSLSPLAESSYSDENIVKGCQSQVWIEHEKINDTFVFAADSDAIIVKGLLAMILVAFNYKTAQEILDFDVDDYFLKLDLLNHISNVRGNGLKAMVMRIQKDATESLA
ncbi:MAG: SufE family protein [Gammaproteobacteria bacterium]|nr:SufE family protein [Gammaproteobacteria bacterium]